VCRCSAMYRMMFWTGATAAAKWIEIAPRF
jgi:hypothetical protein